MKRVITYTILLLSIILTTATAHSQSYPVQANLYVMAPYSQTYSDYYADGQQRMFVNVLLNDMSQGQLDVVLRFTISGNNLKLISKPNTTAKPITILSGKLCRIEGSELAQYLKPEQMQVEGRKADEFNKSGRLPEGYYEIKVEVVEFYRKVRISAPVYTTMWIMQPEAPVWTMPQNGVRLDATNPQFVIFGWMLTNSTSLLQNVKYTFSIYAKPDNMNPDVVARTTTPLYSETLTQTMLVYGPDKPLLELGGTYVCRIKAEDADGNVTFKNDGYSETLVFRYGQTCDPPKQVTITDVTKKGATVNWVESGNYSGYDIEVRETTGGKSSDWYVWNIDKQVHSYDLKQLAVSSSYECRVAAVCGQRSNGIRSQYSDVVSFKTYDAGNKNYTCGDLVEANKHEDRVPYLYLEEGDVIEANGFLFAIESISKASEGVFSGQCSWYIDLWGVSILCDFKDISINRHQQLIAGKIEACRDKVKAKAFTRLQSAAYMPIGTQVPSTFTAEKVIKMEETVDSIRIVNGQTLIYVAGKEPQKVDATDDVFVQSPDGNYYAVEGGNVYPKPSNLDSEGNRQLSYTQQLVATFGYDDAMGSHPGVDSYTDAKAPFAAQYTQYQLHSNDAYATWMAVEKYRTSMAKVTVSGGDRDSIQLRSNGQLMVRTDAAEPDALYMPISTEGLYEAYYTTKDNKGKDVEVVAGQLNVTSYERNNINVCLVGVNGEFYQYSVSELSSYLNQVFGQAVTSINLTTASIEVDKFNGTLSAKESGALSAYNSDMKKLIRKVKKLSDYNDETYYIMLVERSDDQTLGGFMPVNSNFGFVFAKANSGKEQLNRTIAHELAHGAFRLWHTFSSENIYVAQRGSTKNLMDYNGTNAELFKYQWDYIHNPEEGIVKWMVDDEEGEATIMTASDECWKKGRDNWDKVAVQKYDNKKELEYDSECGYFYYGNLRRSYFGLTNGNILIVDQKYDATISEVVNVYHLYVADLGEWYDVDINTFTNDCLSCDLDYIASEVTKQTGKIIGRYILPIEDVYILLEGKDFDGEEASRAVAGGFILIDFIPGGKILKPITKGVKAGIKATVKGSRKIYKYVKGSKVVIGEFADDVLKPAKWVDGEVDEIIETLDDVKYIDKEGKELTGSVQIVKQGDTYGAKVIKEFFKVGDEIAGISIKRIRKGSGEKIAIIGRTMGNETEGVRAVYKELKNKGYDVEIFDEEVLLDEWKEKMVAASNEFRRLSNNGEKWLTKEELIKTDMYKLNKEWANMIKEKGYTILDMGDFNNKGFSVFYAMEKSILFK